MDNFEIQGFDETLKTFEGLRDNMIDDREASLIIRRVMRRFYIPTVRQEASNVMDDPSGKFEKSFDFLDSLTNPYKPRKGYIGTRVGPRVKKKYGASFPEKRGRAKSSGKMQYGAGGYLAAWFEKGTNNRGYRTSGGGIRKTGSIKPTHFQQFAFIRTSHITNRMMRLGLKVMMDKRIKEASK